MCTTCAHKFHTNKYRQPKCPICRAHVTIQDIVHIKYPEDAPHFHVDHAKLLALYESATDASERALENAENITSQLLETITNADELQQTKDRI